MNSHRRILLAGASGLIGARLTSYFRDRGDEVTKLVRRDPGADDELTWDPYRRQIDDRALKAVDVVVNLSGASIGEGRWSSARKRTIYDSRVAVTRFLANQIAQSDEPPQVFVSQSAVGIYGDRGDEILDETSQPGAADDFLAGLTVDWEAAASPARDVGVRVVHPRTGLVISREAQLIARLLPIFKAGLGGPIGDGSQWWSWISLEDNARAVDFLMTSGMSGPVNLVSPRPVRQKDFAKSLATVVGRPSLVPIPRVGMRLALGSEKATAVGLSSTRVVPHRLDENGFRFNDADLTATLERVVA